MFAERRRSRNFEREAIVERDAENTADQDLDTIVERDAEAIADENSDAIFQRNAEVEDPGAIVERDVEAEEFDDNS